jgi:hypothetical protein
VFAGVLSANHCLATGPHSAEVIGAAPPGRQVVTPAEPDLIPVHRRNRRPGRPMGKWNVAAEAGRPWHTPTCPTRPRSLPQCEPPRPLN